MKKTYFTVYYIDTQKNDIKYIREYDEQTKEQIKKDFNLKNKYSKNNYIYNNIDTLDLNTCKKLNDKYIIIKEVETF